MMTVLVVDDDSDVCETLRECLERGLPGVVVRIENEFSEATVRIRESKPDALVLDWYRGDPATGAEAGRAVWEDIWKEAGWFCPVVLYSAGHVDVERDQSPRHPFVQSVTKGGGSEAHVLRHLQEFLPHITAIGEVGEDLVRAGMVVMRSLAPLVFEVATGEAMRLTTLKRATRRRLAAMIDDASALGDPPAHAWEQYVFPVLTDHLLMGDLLRARGRERTQASGYRLVISPTCDLVPYNGVPKVSHVLCARGCTVSEFVEKGLALPTGTQVAKIEKKLRSALNEPHSGGYVLLPACAAAGIPAMAVNLRDLELVPVTQIEPYDTAPAFERVASVDSPYRERFMWAYLEIGCRPGVPRRDVDDLVREAMSAHSSSPLRGQEA